jgi:hypothetical protein
MRYRFFGCLIALEVLALALLVAAGHFAADRMAPVRRANRQLVQVFELTDLSIWTGARYTRHLSQADVFSAFQDSMGALEHNRGHQTDQDHGTVLSQREGGEPHT